LYQEGIALTLNKYLTIYIQQIPAKNMYNINLTPVCLEDQGLQSMKHVVETKCTFMFSHGWLQGVIHNFTEFHPTFEKFEILSQVQKLAI
jgi:hypothetical protein